MVKLGSEFDRLRKENKLFQKTHGLSRSKIYNIWDAMMQRCYNPKNARYKDYGGRGIRVCNRWRRFENFYSDMGQPSEGMTLDRKNNDRGYSPRNCKWSTRLEQQRNNRRNVNITYDGKTYCAAIWGEKLGIPADVIRYRARANWTDFQILFTPYPHPKRVSRYEKIPS